jgi:hypothetical protein
MPIREREHKFIMKSIAECVDRTQADYAATVAVEKTAKAVATVKPLTIQDRIAEKMSVVVAEIDAEVDNVFANKNPDIKLYEYLVVNKVPQAQIGKIRARFQKQIDEITLAVDGKEAQVKEGYAPLLKDKKALKRVGDFYVKLLADLDSYAQVKKATKKARVKKPVAKDKLVAKVKYCKEHKELKIVSANPTEIIGAQAVWIYNSKYRKIGKYVADDHQTLGIKGTSITGYSELKSVCKTLRKPAEQLKEFAKAGKVALRTFLKDIRATETRLNGRLNEDILILKVE